MDHIAPVTEINSQPIECNTLKHIIRIINKYTQIYLNFVAKQFQYLLVLSLEADASVGFH